MSAGSARIAYRDFILECKKAFADEGLSKQRSEAAL
jgi:hypothetical protein